MKKFRVGTRESALAIAQANIVCTKLIEKNPNLNFDSFELVKIKTSGDKNLHCNLADIGGKNLFVKEIEEALLDKKIDFAVHSLKDITAKQNPDLVIAACLEREDPRDAFISYEFLSLNELPKGARVGTSSIRRKYIALNQRDDLIVTPFRGNVLTRLEKLSAKQVDATFLAVAGLKRLNISTKLYHPISADVFIPAISQGVIGVECLADDLNMRDFLTSIDHKETSLCNQAERGFLESLDADCNSPIAAYARIIDNKIYMDSLVIDKNLVHHRKFTSSHLGDGWKMGYEAGLTLKEYL